MTDHPGEYTDSELPESAEESKNHDTDDEEIEVDIVEIDGDESDLDIPDEER
ncbi:hypothetical protein [Agromyces archimandritae]|uniref:Uncharacterized protein n=1 Tax=Agromyces archimandritae TaxID=2781962 RepID=A0A975FN56_9MICO|nr:hypothetical protein [Agromyces archimandritae]QTX04932.1 hypothetical protein G127AT_01350 [Agromyces archimandritae]